MKESPQCPSESSGRKTGLNAPTQFGICIVEETLPPTPPTADPAPAGATARRAPAAVVLPADQPPSVVSKVAKLLVRRAENTPWEPASQPDEGSLHQKVILSLQVKQLM